MTALLVLSNAFIEYSTSGLENPACLRHGWPAGGPDTRLPPSGTTPGGCPRRPTRAGGRRLRADPPRPRADHRARRGSRPVEQPQEPSVARVVPRRTAGAGSRLVRLVVRAYRVLLPNTFSAKRNLDIPTAELVVQGLRYLWVTFETDPVTMVALAAGVGGAIAFGTVVTACLGRGPDPLRGVHRVDRRRLHGRAIPRGAGVCRGVPPRGDASPRFVEGGSSRRSSPDLPSWRSPRWRCSSSAAPRRGETPVALTASHQPRWTVDWNTMGGIADERAFWGADRSLGNIVFNLALAYTQPDFVGPSTGRASTRSLREIDKAAKNWPSRPTPPSASPMTSRCSAGGSDRQGSRPVHACISSTTAPSPTASWPTGPPRPATSSGGSGTSTRDRSRTGMSTRSTRSNPGLLSARTVRAHGCMDCARRTARLWAQIRMRTGPTARGSTVAGPCEPHIHFQTVRHFTSG